MTRSNLSRRVEAALRAVLPNSAGLELAEPAADRTGFEATILDKPLRVNWMSSAWLGDVKKLLTRPDPPDVVVADRVSVASREVLAEHGIGWVETSGAAEVTTDFLVVSRSGLRRQSAAVGGWTPAVLGIAEAILTGVTPTVSATHEATGLSVGACTRALRLLTDLGLLEADAPRGRHAGRRLTDRDRLLDAYVVEAHHLQPSLTLSVGALWRDPVEGIVEIGRRWDESNLPWVATGLVAASVAAPLVTSIGSAEVYVVGDSIPELQLAATTADLHPIEGGRLLLSPFPTETTHQMATVVDGLRIVPWPRLVADLRRSGVRGEEAAEQVKEILGGR